MRPGWIIGLAMLFMIAQLITGVCEAQYIGEDEITLMQQLLSPEIPDVRIPIIGHVEAALTVTWDYLKVLWSMFWFQYPFLTGTWALLKYLLLWPVSIGLVVTLVLAVVRGVRG